MIRGLAINEFTSNDWNTPLPNMGGMRLGDAVLAFRGQCISNDACQV